MSDIGDTKQGVWASLKRIVDTLLAMAQNRIELFVVELEEEKCRVVEALLCVAAIAAFGMMTLSLVTLGVVILFWENGRLLALGVLSAVYLLGTVLAWRALQTRLRAGTSFAGTLAELAKDRSCLENKN